eukprot:TRINITY_DN5014_c0_g1_i1.p1 TRINITY_DN5014_c0_g1~~TRINITY_DN5014_c0_g1_i1.p1  ORF type:complete len:254 (-),score=89.49 TRINITY_DN5014_c0_g1_i1:150-911(-)
MSEKEKSKKRKKRTKRHQEEEEIIEEVVEDDEYVETIVTDEDSAGSPLRGSMPGSPLTKRSAPRNITGTPKESRSPKARSRRKSPSEDNMGGPTHSPVLQASSSSREKVSTPLSPMDIRKARGLPPIPERRKPVRVQSAMLPRQLPGESDPTPMSEDRPEISRKASIDMDTLPDMAAPIKSMPEIAAPMRLQDLKDEIKGTQEELDVKKEEVSAQLHGLEKRSWEELVLQHIELRVSIQQLESEVAMAKHKRQ